MLIIIITTCNNNNLSYTPTLTRFIPYDNYIGRRRRTANESDECNCGCGKDEDNIVSNSHNSLRVDNYIIGREKSQVFRLLLINDSESWVCVCLVVCSYADSDRSAIGQTIGKLRMRIHVCTPTI